MGDEFYEKLKKLATDEGYISDKDMEDKVHKIIQEEFLDSKIISMSKDMEKALFILDKAEKAKDPKRAKKYAEDAYKVCPDCFNAILFLASIEDNPFEALKILNEGLENEKKRLKSIKKYGPIDYEDYIDYCEKTSYLEGLLTKLLYLTNLGRFNKAIEVGLESLMIDEFDEAGVHYILMAIYACLERDEELLNLSKQYDEESIESIFPLFVLAYKQENDFLAIKYLKELNKINSKFFNYFEYDLEEDLKLTEKNWDDDMKVVFYMEAYSFLLNSVPGIEGYILENKSKVIK